MWYNHNAERRAAMEFEKLAAFAKEENIDLTTVGMNHPLVGGIVDVSER